MNPDVIIVGGGASGLFAACEIASKGKSVLVFEPNEKLGRKLRITGKGRCNLTNNCPPDEVVKNINKNPKFLYSALNKFTPQDTISWFEANGVPLKTERGNRVFPVSDKADDIADTLANVAKKSGVKFIKEKVLSIIAENGEVVGVKCKSGNYLAKSVILATGGASYPKTGSTGDGYKMARTLGHTVTELKASLVPIETVEDVSRFSALTLKNVTVTLKQQGKKAPLFEKLGELTFMPYGVAGPLGISCSCLMTEENLLNQAYSIYIDLKSGLTLEQLDKRILRDISELPNISVEKLICKLLPKEMARALAYASKINPDKPCNQITKSERETLCLTLKAYKLTPKALRSLDEAIITSGGVSIKEISPATMESKLVNGLYFTGEIIDCDAFTGGFNLQIAFSTAYVASCDVALK